MQVLLSEKRLEFITESDITRYQILVIFNNDYILFHVDDDEKVKLVDSSYHPLPTYCQMIADIIVSMAISNQQYCKDVSDEYFTSYELEFIGENNMEKLVEQANINQMFQIMSELKIN